MESTVRRLFSKGNGQEGAYRPMSSGENIKTGELKKGDNQKERGKADGRGKVQGIEVEKVPIESNMAKKEDKKCKREVNIGLLVWGWVRTKLQALQLGCKKERIIIKGY